MKKNESDENSDELDKMNKENSDKLDKMNKKIPDELDKTNEKIPDDLDKMNEENAMESDDLDERQSWGLPPAANPWVDSGNPGGPTGTSPAPSLFASKLE